MGVVADMVTNPNNTNNQTKHVSLQHRQPFNVAGLVDKRNAAFQYFNDTRLPRMYHSETKKLFYRQEYCFMGPVDMQDYYEVRT